VGAGLGVTGKTVFIASYATFSPGKNWETIRTTIVYNYANVKVAGHHSGIATGPDGATHQATEDIAITRCWPDMDVIVPCDAIEARKATIESGKNNHPTYLRYTREKTPVMTTDDTPYDPTKIQQYWVSDKPVVTIFGTGYMVYQALLAAKELESEGIQVIVANVANIKPIDEKTIIELAQKTGAIVTIEDHQVMGGMGSAIAEVLAKNAPTPMEFVGMQNTFAESGSLKELMKKYKVDKDAVKEAVKKVIARKK
jgi:transketolase